MTNPFTPTFGVTPPLLVGRGNVLDEFSLALDGGVGDPARAMLLTGVRGAGKTVALNACEDQAHRRGWAVISETVRPGLVDELTSSRLPELLAEVADDATHSAVTAVNVMAAGFGGGVTRQRSEKYPVNASLRSQLTQLADLYGARGGGVLVSLDEVHRAATEDLRVIAHTIQHMFREGRPVAFIGAGPPAAIEHVLNDAVLTFLRRAERFTLGAVSYADVELAIRTPIENSGRKITDGALAAAAGATQGYPFLVQLVGYQMWSVAPDEPVITEKQADFGIDRAVRRVGRLVHEPALGGLSDVDRAFLAAMATDSGPSRIADIAQRMGVNTTYAGQYRIRLMSAELITSAGHGLVRFELPYMREYLLSVAGADEQQRPFGQFTGKPGIPALPTAPGRPSLPAADNSIPAKNADLTSVQPEKDSSRMSTGIPADSGTSHSTPVL